MSNVLPSSIKMRSTRDASSSIKEYLKRFLRVKQMDWQQAITNMSLLLYKPSAVFKESKRRLLIKQQYARDDPAFILLLAWFIIMVGYAYAISFQSGVFHHFKFMAWLILVDYLGVGIIISTLAWGWTNYWMNTQSSRNVVEWLYAFDVHVNSFFTFFIYIYLVQYIFVPFLLWKNWIAIAAGNALYAIGFSSYFYVTFRGYLEIDSLAKPKVFLYPIIPIVLFCILATLLKFSLVNFVIFKIYF